MIVSRTSLGRLVAVIGAVAISTSAFAGVVKKTATGSGNTVVTPTVVISNTTPTPVVTVTVTTNTTCTVGGVAASRC